MGDPKKFCRSFQKIKLILKFNSLSDAFYCHEISTFWLLIFIEGKVFAVLIDAFTIIFLLENK